MVDAPTLYPPEMLEHAGRPAGAGRLERATHEARVDNPLCGDRIDLQLRIEGARIVDVRHRTRGCALCVASASMLVGAIEGLEVEAAKGRAEAVPGDLDALIQGEPREHGVIDPAFAGIARAPARRRCVALPWEALLRAIG